MIRQRLVKRLGYSKIGDTSSGLLAGICVYRTTLTRLRHPLPFPRARECFVGRFTQGGVRVASLPWAIIFRPAGAFQFVSIRKIRVIPRVLASLR